MQHIKI